MLKKTHSKISKLETKSKQNFFKKKQIEKTEICLVCNSEKTEDFIFLKPKLKNEHFPGNFFESELYGNL